MDPFRMDEHVRLPLSQDAALVAALAGTAMAFAHSTEDQAERWLRALRLHGQVGAALQALGVGEAPLMTRAEPVGDDPGVASAAEGMAERVIARAGELASARAAGCVGTPDLLFSLLDLYGGLIDRALYVRGASRGELVEQLTAIGERGEGSARPLAPGLASETAPRAFAGSPGSSRHPTPR